MKILVLNYEYPPVGGGGGKVSEEVARRLSERGHQVKVLTVRTAGLPKRELRSSVEVLRIFAFRRRRDTCSVLEMAFFLAAAFFPALFLTLRWKPDVIHVHFAVPTGVLAYAIRMLTGTPYVLTVHCGDVPGCQPEDTDKLFKWIKPFTMPVWRCAALVTGVSSSIARMATRAYPGVRIQAIPNGIDPTPARVDFWSSGKVKKILFAGRFSHQKNPLLLVRVLASIAKREDWTADLYGEGPLASEVRAFVKNVGLESRIRLHGWVDPSVVDAAMQKSDILLLTSRAEGMSVAVLRALDRGLAVVVSHIPGNEDLVCSGENGYLCDPHKEDEFKDALVRILNSDTLLSRMKKCSKRMAGQFEWSRVMDQYEKALSDSSHGVLKEYLRVKNCPRLLIFCYEFSPVGGGAGNALMHLAALWSSSCDVVVVTSGYQDLSSEERMGNVHVLRLNVGRRELSRGRIFEMARYVWRSLCVAEEIARNYRPTLCVAFMGVPSGVAPLYLNLKLGIPFVTELRGGDVPGFDPRHLRYYHKLVKPLIRFIWKRSASLIANSEGLKELAEQSTPNHPVKVVPNGVDTNRFFPQDPLQTKNSKNQRLLYVGRLAETQKNVGVWIRALKEIPTANLMIVGDGPDRKKLELLAGQIGVAQRIIFTGWLKKGVLEKAYQDATVYVTAALWEGMPNAVLEAMACGLPIVASRIAGHDEMVVDQKTGFLFDPKRPQDGVDAVCAVLSDSALASRMGRDGRRRVQDNFSWDEMARRHLEIFGMEARAAVEAHGPADLVG